MDAFYASVEQRDDPALRGKPVLVGGTGGRGVVCAASYESRVFGCRSAMPMGQAIRLCPQAIIVRPNFERYVKASEQVFAIFESFTPEIEGLSLDEAFLDVSGSVRLLGTPRSMAETIRERVQREVRLTCSVGVAPNKFLAKLASDLRKPDGLTEVPADRNGIIRMLAPLPVSRMWGIGPKAEARLVSAGIRTVGDMQTRTVEQLSGVLGAWGARCWELCHGIDDRPVVTARQAKSVGHEETFGVDVGSPEDLRSILMQQVEHVARRLRKHALKGRTITLKLRYPDFDTLSRSRTLARATDSTNEIWTAAAELLEAFIASPDFGALRLLGVSISELDGGEGTQLELFAPAQDARHTRLDQATDAISKRFGPGAVKRGRSLRHEE